MQILDPDLDREPYQMGVKVIEGPAVSRVTLPVKIAYCPEGQDKIRLATLRYGEDGTPVLEDDRLVIDGHDLPAEEGVAYSGMIEPQNWRPPDEKELIFSRYSYSEAAGFLSETWGWHSETGELVNYSNMPDQYAEPEGIFPDGEHTLIESDLDDGRGVSHLDLYSLKLDGSGETVRLTHFADIGAWKANNGVVSPDGRHVAFQESQGGSAKGGDGSTSSIWRRPELSSRRRAQSRIGTCETDIMSRALAVHLSRALASHCARRPRSSWSRYRRLRVQPVGPFAFSPYHGVTWRWVVSTLRFGYGSSRSQHLSET